MTSDKREIKDIIDKLLKAGWRVTCGDKHYMAFPVDRTKGPVTISKTPRCPHALFNIRGDLKRAGWVQ